MNSDVCIITEGTFPYVMGGVSTWIAQIIESMPDIKFSVVNISASRKEKHKIRYELPKNLVGLSDAYIIDYSLGGMTNLEELQDVFLFDYAAASPEREIISRHTLSREKEEALFELYHALSIGKPLDMRAIPGLVAGFASDADFMGSMVHSYSAWEVTKRLYESIGIPGLSFLDYFWSLRAQFMPILNILRAPLPKARVYHAACTGYAGLLGARAACESGRPLILTEHGIYTRERRIELASADWLSLSGESRFLQFRRSRNWFRERWMALFASLAKSAYDNASKIISLYRGNALIQIGDGAPPAKLAIIPNGIITDKLKNIARSPKSPGEKLRIGFVGRVVSIKDIKTLLRAMSLLAGWDVPFEATIVGPLDEEPEYVAQCFSLLEKLRLQDRVFFVGPRRDLEKVYADMDVLLLTSASEGFPYVILEANCAGLPVVATDVGACREMLSGAGQDELGPSGRITAVGSPEETAAQLAWLARNPQAMYAYGQAGRQRVLRDYDLAKIMRQYRDIYTTYMAAAKKSGPGGEGRNADEALREAG